MVDGAAHQAQGGHAAARGLDLGEDQEGDDHGHQGIGQCQTAAQVQPHGSRQNHHAEQVEGHFLSPDVGSEQFFHRQIVAAAVLQGLTNPFVPLAGEVEGLDDAHALELLQHRLHQPGLVPLALRGDFGGLFLHAGEEQQVQRHPGQGQQADAPVPEQHTQQHDGGVDEPAQDSDQHHGSGALHLVQDGGGDAGEFP